jgi:hypothetical protein
MEKINYEDIIEDFISNNPKKIDGQINIEHPGVG